MSKRLFVAALLVVVTVTVGTLYAQVTTETKDVVVVKFDPRTPGTWILQITVDTNGKASVSPLEPDYVLGDATDPPDPPPTGSETQQLTAKLTAEALAKPGSSATTAKALSIVYDRVGNAFEAGDLTAATAAQAIRDASSAAVETVGDPVGNWQPMLDGVDAHVTNLRERGVFTAQSCHDAEAGVEYVLANRGLLDNIDWEVLLKIIELILKILVGLEA